MTTRRSLLLAALAVLPLAACGRRGKPIPPEDSTYPRQYPKIDFPDQQNRQKAPETETE
jgi:predicted small lipoprotein YifL